MATALAAENDPTPAMTATTEARSPISAESENWHPPTWAYKRFRKRIETIFSQLNDNLMICLAKIKPAKYDKNLKISNFGL